ncbi:QRFP-like peptide receptor [Branchiostoma lanceolatum]|uniref:QRFP-like peptide receptor n=1 Tax=Branchiostoma lanceolatum TaxID=7740 RepID=UPI00345516CE
MDGNASTTYLPAEQFFFPENFTYGNVTNTKYFPYPGEFRHLSDGEKAGKIIAYLVIFIMAIVGNSLVIYTVSINKKMRTTTNFYLTNLAVADILIAVCCMWVALIKDLTDPVWIFGDFMCRFNTFMQGISITSSVVMLTVIAIDRFYAIIFPLKARITETNTAAVISTVWLISCAVNVPLLVVSEQKQWQWDDGVLEIWCAEKWDQHQKAIYTSVLFVVLYAVPLVVMMVAYFLLARKLWRTTSPGIAALSIQQLQLKAKKKI